MEPIFIKLEDKYGNQWGPRWIFLGDTTEYGDYEEVEKFMETHAEKMSLDELLAIRDL